MKKLFIFIFVVFIAVNCLYAKAIQEDIDLTEEKAKTSYAIGMLMGNNLKSMNIDLEYHAYLEGVRAIMEGAETKISLNEAGELADAAIDRAENLLAEEQRLMQETFLSDNSAKPGVRVTESGLQYLVLSEGEGEKPAHNAVVRVNYTGRLIDDTEFDRSDDEGAFIPLDMVIPGWGEGLQLMNTGSKYRFFIPANLAYGKNGVRGIIPQYATLIFDVELLEIMDRKDFFADEAPELEF